MYGIEAGQLLGMERKRTAFATGVRGERVVRHQGKSVAEYLNRDTSMTSRLPVANAEKRIGSRSWSYSAGSGLSQQLMPDPIDPLQQAMIDKLSVKIQLMVVPQGQNFFMELPATGGSRHDA